MRPLVFRVFLWAWRPSGWLPALTSLESTLAKVHENKALTTFRINTTYEEYGVGVAGLLAQIR